MEKSSVSRLAFGSCNNQDLHNKLWPIIERRHPSGFIWGGDSIYADQEKWIDWSTFPPKIGNVICADGKRLRKLYKQQKKIPGYKSFIESNVTIFGTIDDHDYGCDNADRNFPHRKTSAEAFVDFLGEPRHSAFAARARKGFGVYGVKVFDFERPVGKQSLSDFEAGIDPDVISPYLNAKGGHPRHSNKSVAVFVLDVRSNKTPWRKGLEAFRPDMDGDFLGKEQWEWLEAAVPRSRAAVNIFVSGLQVHANIFPDGNKAESWGKYPRAQQRLFDLILQDSVGAPILISGDVHMAQFMRKDCKRDVLDAYARPLIEMTTSGMTHSWGSLSSPPIDDINKEPTIFEQYATLASRTLMTLLHHFCPWTDLMRMPSIQDNLIDERNYESGGSDGAKQGKQFSLEKNFGEIEIDWNSQRVTMRAIGENEKVLLSASWSIDQLSGRSIMTDSFLSEKQYIDAKRHVNAQGEWTCISYRGPVSEIYHTGGHIISGVIFIVSFPFPLIVLSYFLVGQFCGLWKKRRNLGKKSSNLL